MNLTCTFEDYDFYTSVIRSQKITEGEILNISGKLTGLHSKRDVESVMFIDCNMTRVPQGLTKIFPNIVTLHICNSGLQTVKKEDLAEYKKQIEEIDLSKNLLKFLPADLFDDCANLEYISFRENKLMLIEPTIFRGLKNLHSVDLRDNPNYNFFFNPLRPNNLEYELKIIFSKNIHLYKEIIRKELEKELDIFSDINSILLNEEYKDFKILIGEHEFYVHKFILAARSPTLAELLKNNPEVEKLSLSDIPSDTFKVILKHMYTAEMPKVIEYNQLSLYAAAGRLKMEKLKNFVAKHVLEQMKDKNAFDVLKLSNKYDHNELKQKSFDVIKKMYPKLMFKEEWIEQPETVRKIIEKFEEKEKAIKKLEADFENQRVNM